MSAVHAYAKTNMHLEFGCIGLGQLVVRQHDHPLLRYFTFHRSFPCTASLKSYSY